MVWTTQHTAKSHQAKADLKMLPLVLDLRKRGCSYRDIARELDLRCIPPPAAYAVNEFQSGAGWSKMAVQRLCKRHGIKGGAPAVSGERSHVEAGG